MNKDKGIRDIGLIGGWEGYGPWRNSACAPDFKKKIKSNEPWTMVHLTLLNKSRHYLCMSNIPVIVEENEESALSRTILQCMTGKFRELTEALPPEIRELDVHELEKRFMNTPKLRCLKIGLWTEYHRVVSGNLDHMSIVNICSGVCSRENFYSHVISRPEILAWLLHPTTEYDRKAEEALDFGIDRLRKDILTAPILDEKGRYNPIVGSQIIQAIKFLDARVKGSPLQRVEQKTLHAHAHVHKHEGVTRESLMQEMREIESRLMGTQPLLIQAPDETE